MKSVSRISVRSRVYARVAVVAVLVLAIGACKKEQAATEASSAQGPAASQPVAPPAQAVSAQVAAMSVDQLREAARKAGTENRIYAPSGDNAVEYYLALRDKQPNDAAVISALSDFTPFMVIAIEQARDRDDFVEAQRLYGMLEKTDKQAPALPRLKQTIADAQTSLAQRTAAAETKTDEEKARLALLEEERAKQQQLAQQQAAQQLATQQAADQAAAQRAADQRAADERAAAQRAADERAAAQRAEQTTTGPAATPATTGAAASNELRAVSTPAPRYPPEALRAGTSGEVQVEFTVATDGSVSNARVVRANPPRVFDREAVAAVRRWRFQPVGSPVTTRRTIGFNPGG